LRFTPAELDFLATEMPLLCSSDISIVTSYKHFAPLALKSSSPAVIQILLKA
jgi:hypothetical protein